MAFGCGFSIPAFYGAASGLGMFASASLYLDFTSGNQTLDPRTTFSRASNATVVGKDGTTQYAPHNLLTYSEQFDNAAWANDAFSGGVATVTANAVAAPDGTTTADTVMFTASTNQRRLQAKTSISTGVTHTFSIYVKKGSLSSVVVVCDYINAPYIGIAYNFDTDTLMPGTGITASRVIGANGWVRIIGSWAALGTSMYCGLASTSTGTVQVWGAQLNVGPLQPYYPTTVKNLLGFTQEFDNAAWTKSNSTVTANAATAPDGTLTANKLVENTANNSHSASVTTSTLSSGTPYSFSLYAKASEAGRYLAVALGGTAFTSVQTIGFTLSGNGSFAVLGGSAATPTIQNIGNGWYRCSVTSTAQADGTGLVVYYLSTSGTSGAGLTYTGDGTSGIYVWGAQLSDSASLDPYVYNPGAAPSASAYYGPRFDYDPVTLQPKGLLIEGQRTNSIRNNTMQGAVAGTPGTPPTNWVTIGAGLGTLTQQIVGTGTSNGINYIDLKLSGTTSTTSFGLSFDAPNQVVASSTQTWTSSFWISLVAGAITNITAIENRVTERDSTGTFLATTTFDMKPSLSALLTRREVSRTLSGGTAARVSGELFFTFASGAAIDITLRIGMPQLELGAFATSVIPTTSAQATRAADVATMTGTNFSSWYRQDEGTLFGEFEVPTNRSYSGTFRTVAQISPSGSSITYVHLLVNNAIQFNFYVQDGATVQANISNGSNTGTISKLAGCYRVNDFALSANGAASMTDTSGQAPITLPPTQMTIGGVRDGNVLGNINGHIRRIAYFPRRLSNAELQGITS